VTFVLGSVPDFIGDLRSVQLGFLLLPRRPSFFGDPLTEIEISNKGGGEGKRGVLSRRMKKTRGVMFFEHPYSESGQANAHGREDKTHSRQLGAKIALGPLSRVVTKGKTELVRQAIRRPRWRVYGAQLKVRILDPKEVEG